MGIRRADDRALDAGRGGAGGGSGVRARGLGAVPGAGHLASVPTRVSGDRVARAGVRRIS
ncbi:hypothetical protein W824_07380 [Clavibacter cf. michiganensis LMG 26808]|nr:hypothetical protein W824_07380 [Clavibacter cf. michiganensis LMG 26808]